MVILVDVVDRGHQHQLGREVALHLDQELEDRLADLGEGAHLEVVHGERRLGEPEPR